LQPKNHRFLCFGGFLLSTLMKTRLQQVAGPCLQGRSAKLKKKIEQNEDDDEERNTGNHFQFKKKMCALHMILDLTYIF